jgi:hypothetical protein
MLGVLALVLVTCTGCDTADLPRLAFPTPATEEAPRILLIWQGSWLAALITGAVVWGLILWSCVFHRKKHADDVPIQTRYNLPIEALYTIVPFVMVVTLFYFTQRDESILLDQGGKEAHTINVVGRRYPGHPARAVAAGEQAHPLRVDLDGCHPLLVGAELPVQDGRHARAHEQLRAHPEQARHLLRQVRRVVRPRPLPDVLHRPRGH